jgi:hypothetical protein
MAPLLQVGDKARFLTSSLNDVHTVVAVSKYEPMVMINDISGWFYIDFLVLVV